MQPVYNGFGVERVERVIHATEHIRPDIRSIVQQALNEGDGYSVDQAQPAHDRLVLIVKVPNKQQQALSIETAVGCHPELSLC